MLNDIMFVLIYLPGNLLSAFVFISAENQNKYVKAMSVTRDEV